MNKSALSLALAQKLGAFALALWLGLGWSAGHAQESCERAGIEFGFFNGVKTQERSAQDVVEEFLPLLYGRTTPDGQPINYTLYYNDTDPWLTDFVETFDQRLQEHGGLLSERFELFFSALQGGGDWWSRITGTVSTLRGVLDGIHDASQAAIARAVTAAFGNPGSFEVSQRHREQIDHALAMDKGLLLFAHSQGNLFVNQAYDHARSQVGAESVRVIHVAPASPRATGPHVLADLDVVINALRVVGFVLPNTDVIPLPMERIQQRDLTLSDEWDVAGHGLLPTYLNRNFQPSARIGLYVYLALLELRPPRRNPAAPYPPFVDLPWQGGARPQPNSSFEETMSHTIEELRESSTDGGTWTYRHFPRTSHGRWSGSWRSLPRGEWDSFETRFISETSGPGMSGSLVCTHTQTVVSGTDTRTKRVQRRCEYSHYPARLFPDGRGTPWALRDLGPVPDGTVRSLNSASWGPSFSVYTQRYDPATNTYPRTVAFLDGEITFEEIKRYRRSPLSGQFVSDETLLRRRTDTVQTGLEPFAYSSLATSNQAAIAAWDAAYREWQTDEAERFRLWSERERAHRQRMALCAPPPPPPIDGECSIEDPRATCLQPS